MGIDNNDTALKTFEKNHPGSKGLNIDLIREDFVDEIKRAIEIIDSNYDYYSNNARSFYSSCDIDSLLKEIVRKEVDE